MSSVVFIGGANADRSYEQKPALERFKESFYVDMYDVLWRIVASFVPPVPKPFRRVYVDFLGPSLALVLLAALINYGYSGKGVTFSYIGPNEFLFCYCLFVPSGFYILSRCGQSNVCFSEVLSLIGYALYGHLFTLALSYVCFDEESDAFFFLCLIAFCGLSTLRLVLVVLQTIPRPGLRLIVCSVLAIVQILSLIFIHFAYMHRTYKYRQFVNRDDFN